MCRGGSTPRLIHYIRARKCNERLRCYQNDRASSWSSHRLLFSSCFLAHSFSPLFRGAAGIIGFSGTRKMGGSFAIGCTLLW